MSARTSFLDALQAILDSTVGLEDVTLIRSARQVGEVGQKPILQARTTEWTRTPQAPMRNITWTGTATLVSPHRDLDAAEDQLEELLDLITTSLTSFSFTWSAAPLVNYDDQHLAVDINVTAIFQKG